MQGLLRHYNPVTAIFVVLSLTALAVSGMRPVFVCNEVITRFIRDGVMVLALIIPITAGMGLNFAIVVGAICAQVGLILAVDYQLGGLESLALIMIVGVALSILLGYMIGLCLNRARGREMITTILIGFLATSMYQLIFMVGYGTIITPRNPEMMLSRGVGIRNMVDLDRFRNLLDSIWVLRFGEIEVPLFMLLVVCFMALVVNYTLHTRLGRHFSAVGFSGDRVEALGLDPRLIRIKAIILSTVIACLGHIIFIQNIGMLNVYTAHLNTDIFSCAALLAGGATVTRAKVRHALIGIVLFHTLFVVSPQAGQNLFGNPALGEYFRSFVAYGTIAVALILNAKNSDKSPRGPGNKGSKNLLEQEPATGSCSNMYADNCLSVAGDSLGYCRKQKTR
jgi:simple sugar transport system permease protein